MIARREGRRGRVLLGHGCHREIVPAAHAVRPAADRAVALGSAAVRGEPRPTHPGTRDGDRRAPYLMPEVYEHRDVELLLDRGRAWWPIISMTGPLAGRTDSGAQQGERS